MYFASGCAELAQSELLQFPAELAKRNLGSAEHSNIATEGMLHTTLLRNTFTFASSKTQP
jgi:hypothetical protein